MSFIAKLTSNPSFVSDDIFQLIIAFGDFKVNIRYANIVGIDLSEEMFFFIKCVVRKFAEV